MTTQFTTSTIVPIVAILLFYLFPPLFAFATNRCIRIPASNGSTCPDCGQDTVCDKCGECHYCCDKDLPCPPSARSSLFRAMIKRIDITLHCLQERKSKQSLRTVTTACNVLQDTAEPSHQLRTHDQTYLPLPLLRYKTLDPALDGGIMPHSHSSIHWEPNEGGLAEHPAYQQHLYEIQENEQNEQQEDSNQIVIVARTSHVLRPQA